MAAKEACKTDATHCNTAEQQLQHMGIYLDGGTGSTEDRCNTLQHSCKTAATQLQHMENTLMAAQAVRKTVDIS